MGYANDWKRRYGDLGACLPFRRGGGHAEGRINLGRVGSVGRRRIRGRAVPRPAVPVAAASAVALWRRSRSWLPGVAAIDEITRCARRSVLT
jgi:hypothetical protein